MDEIGLRRLTGSDYAAVRDFFRQGIRYQRSLGFTQWLDGYPNDDLLERDYETGRGFIIEIGGKPAGYVVIDTAGDAEYDRLSHIWRLSGPYAAVHRIVLGDSFRGKGYGSRLLEEIEIFLSDKGVAVIRFDTGVDNLPMQTLLKKSGYTDLGHHVFVWGPRFTYEKGLDPK